jgi:hypothetical protein
MAVFLQFLEHVLNLASVAPVLAQGRHAPLAQPVVLAPPERSRTRPMIA